MNVDPGSAYDYKYKNWSKRRGGSNKKHQDKSGSDGKLIHPILQYCH